MPKEVEEGQEILVEVVTVGREGSRRSVSINITITSSSSDLDTSNTAGD